MRALTRSQSAAVTRRRHRTALFRDVMRQDSTSPTARSCSPRARRRRRHRPGGGRPVAPASGSARRAACPASGRAPWGRSADASRSAHSCSARLCSSCSRPPTARRSCRPASSSSRSWEAGPLHGLFGYISVPLNTIDIGLSAWWSLMTVAYGVALARGPHAVDADDRRLRPRAARDPAAEPADAAHRPVQLPRLRPARRAAPPQPVHACDRRRRCTIRSTGSPPGTTCAARTGRCSPRQLPARAPAAAGRLLGAEAVVARASLGFIALVWKCAKLLGRDPRFAILFVAANPVYLMYAVGGFHNDFFMLVPSTAAIALLLARRDRSAGAMLMLAVAVKFTASLCCPSCSSPPAPTAAAAGADRRGAGARAPRPHELRAVWALRAQPPGPEHAADRLQRAQPVRRPDRHRRRHPAAAAYRQRRPGGHGHLLPAPAARLALRRRLVDARADR